MNVRANPSIELPRPNEQARKQTALWTLKRSCANKDKDMEELRLQLSELQQRAVNQEAHQNNSNAQVKDELKALPALRATVTELRQLLDKARQTAAAATTKQQETQKLLDKEIQDASAARAQHQKALDGKAKALLTERHVARKLSAKANALEEKLRIAAR